MKKNNALFIIVSLVLGIYLALVIGLYFFQRQIIYNPSESMPSPMEAGVPEMQELKVTSLDGNLLKFWYRPSYNNQPTIIFMVMPEISLIAVLKSNLILMRVLVYYSLLIVVMVKI